MTKSQRTLKDTDDFAKWMKNKDREIKSLKANVRSINNPAIPVDLTGEADTIKLAQISDLSSIVGDGLDMIGTTLSIVEGIAGQIHVTNSDGDSVGWIDLEFQRPVADKDLTTSPGSPSDGDRYIIAGIGGDWSGGSINDIVIYDEINTTWIFITPLEGMLLWIQDENRWYYFETSWKVLSDSLIFNKIKFDIAATPTLSEGEMGWNANDKTANIKTDTDTILQVGQEFLIRGTNKTGGTLLNGTVVYINGADVGTDRPTFTKANATTWEDSQTTIGIVTSDIADDAQGFVTTNGLVRDVDTSGMTAGDMIYLSATAGELTTTRPTQPDFIIELGIVVKVDASDGILFVNVDNSRDYGYFNGTFVETFDCLITSNGTTITASLQRAGGGNLTMRFGSGPFTTLVTPPMTIALTAGTATVPQENFLYILESDQTQITKSTSGYPTNVAHIKISKVVVLTAGITQTDVGALANQNVNDHAVDTIGMGHNAHAGEWIRSQPSTYVPPGIAGNSSTGDDYLEIETVPDAVYFRSTAGNVRQFHLQAFPVMDTGSIDGSGTDFLYVINDPDAAYTKVTELIVGIDKLSTGVAIGNNKYFGVVFLGIANKTGELQVLMCNLPAGQYNSQLGAENDLSGFSNFTIPDEYLSTGFLICKLVIQKVGSTWAYKSTKDLRGLTPAILIGGGGAGGGTVVDFPDNTHRISDEADPTKQIAHDAGSLISTGNIRVATMPDKDLTLIDTADAVDAVEAVGVAVPIPADWFIFSDAGVLKRALMSAIDETVLTAIKSYIDGLDHHSIYVISKAIVDALRITELGTVTVGNIDAIANYIANTDINWNGATVSQAEAEAGIATTDRKWTAERVKQAIAALGAAYSDPQAIAAVEGEPTLELSGVVNITPNTDSSTQAGRAHIGYMGYADIAGFSHVDMDGLLSYALLQDSAGNTFLNAATTRYINFAINHAEIMRMTAAGLEIGNNGIHIGSVLDEDAMGSNSAVALATQQSIKAYVDSQDHHDIFSPGLVTAHSDVSNAGSGIIISAAERTAIDLLKLSGISSHIEYTHLGATHGHDGLTSAGVTEAANNLGVYYRVTGTNFIRGMASPPDWLVRYAAENSKTITVTTIDIKWDNTQSADYITAVLIDLAPVDSSSDTTIYNNTTNLGQGSTGFRSDTCNVTDTVVPEGATILVRAQVVQGVGSSCRIRGVAITYTIA